MRQLAAAFEFRFQMAREFQKRIRLPLAAYQELINPCAITICTHERANIFKDHAFAFYCIELLKQLCSEGRFRIFAFCFMPNHVHLLIQGNGSTSIVSLVQKFKSISTLESRKFGLAGRIYQPRFYDHFLRNEEDVAKQARYILENPVRKRLVNSICDYPLSGSLVFDIK